MSNADSRIHWAGFIFPNAINKLLLCVCLTSGVRDERIFYFARMLEVDIMLPIVYF